MQEHSDAWHGRMTAFLDRCRAARAGKQAAFLREAYRLQRMRDARTADAADDRKFDRLLAQSAFECAALEVLGPRAEYELSCGKTQTLSARVRLAGRPQFYIGEGQTIALALLAAWARAHLAEASNVLAISEAERP
ncbi:MAG: hypothetical protein QM676_14340 [Novosphingobium sp.]